MENSKYGISGCLLVAGSILLDRPTLFYAAFV